MQTYEVISISGGVSVQSGPLALDIIISMIKDAYEDYKRFVSDQSENKAQTTYLEIGEDKVTQKWAQNHWKDINCGMIVKVVGDEQIPADMILV